MKLKGSRTGAMLATAAALCMVASPALADRGWGGGGWGHRDRDDTGAWVVGGIIGIGMIAAIASAASKSDKNRRVRDRDYRDDDYYRNDDYRYRDNYRGDNSYRDNSTRDRGYSASSRGIDGAVDTCVSEIERGAARVDTVDTVGRDGDGWRISGRVSGGRSFDCAVDGGGRIRSVTVDGSAVR